MMTVVLKSSPQASQTQWWRISPSSTNSEASAAISGSLQDGQQAGGATRGENSIVVVWIRMFAS
jgi:hypothetical protein